MPELSRFFGIVIRMFAEGSGPHHLPHFHAYYQGEVAEFTIDEVSLLGGSIPHRQRRLVEAWAEIHREELHANWSRLMRGEPPIPIEALR